MRYTIHQQGVAVNAGLGWVGPQYRFGTGRQWTGYTGPQYQSRCIANNPAVMPVLPCRPCPQHQSWPPNAPSAIWPPPGTPYYGRPDQPPPPGTVLCA